MPSSDPVGDMLAMIKNAYGRRHKRVSLTHSRMKEGVAKVLRSEGYLEDVKSVADEVLMAEPTLAVIGPFETESDFLPTSK